MKRSLQGKDFTPLIITGAKRSGTSLLQYLLDSTPGTFNLLDESYFFEYLYDIGEENIDSFITLQRTAGIDELLESTQKRSLFHFFDKGYYKANTLFNKQSIDIKCDFHKLRIVLEKTQKKLDGSIKSTWDFWTHAIMDAMGCNKIKVDVVIAKSPDYGKSALIALKYITNSKILIMIRDPIYAIDSLKRSRQIRQEKEVHLFELLNVIKDYKLLTESIEYMQRNGFADRVKIIRYEELVNYPRKTMRSISDFIGIRFHEVMLKPTLYGKIWYGQSSFKKFDRISASPTKRKIMTLNDWEIRYINSQLSDFIKTFKYADDIK